MDFCVPILTLSPRCSSSFDRRQYNPAEYVVFSCILAPLSSFVEVLLYRKQRKVPTEGSVGTGDLFSCGQTCRIAWTDEFAIRIPNISQSAHFLSVCASVAYERRGKGRMVSSANNYWLKRRSRIAHSLKQVNKISSSDSIVDISRRRLREDRS